VEEYEVGVGHLDSIVFPVGGILMVAWEGLDFFIFFGDVGLGLF
jgi:hypothetical protein